VEEEPFRPSDSHHPIRTFPAVVVAGAAASVVVVVVVAASTFESAADPMDSKLLPAVVEGEVSEEAIAAFPGKRQGRTVSVPMSWVDAGFACLRLRIPHRHHPVDTTHHFSVGPALSLTVLPSAD